MEEYPPGFPSHLKPTVVVMVMRVERAFPRRDQVKERIKEQVFGFGAIACKAAERGEWTVDLALDGLYEFLDWRIWCEHGNFLGTNPRELVEFGETIREEVRDSNEWLDFVEKLAEVGRANLAPARPEPSSETSRREATRLHCTISSPGAARRLEAYLREHGIGLTDFATMVNTTDRTLRSFRKTGKVRRDIFENIAKAMGTTKDELLRSSHGK